MEVCIVGGGFSGIISCKVALSHSFIPTVLNKNKVIGGLWSNEGDEGVWESLTLNGSKHIAGFSDHLWPVEDSYFPPARSFKSYLSSYVQKHNLSQFFQNNSTVQSITFENPGYKVTWKNQSETITKFFPYVIIANGRFHRPSINLPGLNLFKGTVLHSSEYRSSDIFKGKKVVCIGKGVSGSEISLDALKTAEKVTQIWRSKMIIVPKTVKGAPYDYIFNSVQNFSSHKNFINYKDEVPFNQMKLMKFIGNPGDIIEEWRITDDEIMKKVQHGQHSCSNEYVEAVKSRKIFCQQGNVVGLDEGGVRLEGGETVKADVVVICTGYWVDLEFLSQEIKDKIQYERDNRISPFIAYRRILHPDLPGLGFVGYVFGASGRYELQSEIILRYFSNILHIPNQELWQGVNQELSLRFNNPTFYSEYDPLGYVKECLRILRLTPNLDYVRGCLGLASGPFVPYFLFTDRPGQTEICSKFLSDYKSRLPKL